MIYHCLLDSRLQPKKLNFLLPFIELLLAKIPSEAFQGERKKLLVQVHVDGSLQQLILSYKMTEQQSSEWVQQSKKTKEYSCSCGKTYFSNPALYTHIRNSHDGITPPGVRKPDSQRGRPKTVRNDKLQRHAKAYQIQVKEDPIPDLINFLNTVPEDNGEIREIYEKEPVYKLLEKFATEPDNFKWVAQDKIFDVRIGPGIWAFLKELQKQGATPAQYSQMLLLITLTTEYIIEQTEDRTVLENGNISLIAQFVNYFILYDVKNHVQRLKLENIWICNGKNMIIAFIYFFRWMLFKKYSLTKLEINFNFPDAPKGSEFFREEIVSDGQRRQLSEKEEEALKSQSVDQGVEEDDEGQKNSSSHYEESESSRQKQQ